jgi:hypothetical protein
MNVIIIEGIASGETKMPIRKIHLLPHRIWSRPKEKGGLGVLNLSMRNDCLLMKHLHKFYNHANFPSANIAWELYYSCLPPLRTRDISFWWRYCLKALPAYKQLATWQQMDGQSIILWHDAWRGAPLRVA